MNLIFIGYILIFFHFKINGFDLLPDFVGYLLIFNGLGKLAADSEWFAKAKPWAVVMVVESIFYGLVGLFGETLPEAFYILGIVFTVVSLYLMYLIGQGIRDTEQKRQIEMGGTRFGTLFKVQVVLTMLCQVSAALGIGVIATLTLFPTLIANIVFLIYLYRAKKALDEAKENTETDMGGF